MKIFFRFFKYTKKYLRHLILANIMMLLFVFFSLLSVTLIMPFIDLLFNQNAHKIQAVQHFSVFDIKEYITYQISILTSNYTKMQLVVYLCIGMIIVFFLKNLFSYLQTYFMSTVEQGMIKDIRVDLYAHFHKLSLSYFTEEKKGILISRIINDVQIIKDSMVAVINSIFRDPTVIVVFSIVLFIFNWKLTLLIYFMLPIVGFLLAKIGNSLKRRSIRSQEKIAVITSILDETFGAMRIVKAFGMEDYEINKFAKEDERYYSLLTSLVRRRALAAPITEFIGVIFVTIILYFIGSNIVSGKSDITPGVFFAYLGIFFQMMPSLKLLGQVFNSIKEGTAASERVFKILDTQPQIYDSPGAIEKKSFEDKIQFCNVSFEYEKNKEVLNDVSLDIRKGQVIAIVGPSGAGKSTLVDLIPRFYDVNSGEIKLDGINIKDLKIKSLLSLIGIVSQETILFNDTVFNNIAYGSYNLPLENVIEAAKAANAHNFITKLSKGYDTVIGDRGVKLSGGEQQRISIARALLKNPPILILDEATSSLDTESEALVQIAIEKLMQGRTSVVIAHRLSTTQNADKIIVLNNGKIVESGTHGELIKLDKLYNKLFKMQFRL